MSNAVDYLRTPSAEIEKVINGLPAARARILVKAVNVLREFYDPPAIFLFGSSAKQMAGELSDIDLLVRMKSREPRPQRGAEFKEVFIGSYPRIDLVIFNDEEVRHHLENPHSFLSSVMSCAKPLYLKCAQTELLLQPKTSLRTVMA